MAEWYPEDEEGKHEHGWIRGEGSRWRQLGQRGHGIQWEGVEIPDLAWLNMEAVEDGEVYLADVGDGEDES